MPIVTIIYRFMPQYRVDFFTRLRAALIERKISLDLIYGQNSVVPRKDEVNLDWATALKNRIFRVGKTQFYWQPLPRRVEQSDLVILMQENKMLNNYSMLLKSLFSHRRLAFWDHGINFQAQPGSLGNRFKKMYSTKVHWWFAYTEGVKRIVSGMGFPSERITVVENTIDTRALALQGNAVQPKEVESLRRSLGMGGGPVGIYCGGMYAEKRLRFLFQACEAIRKHLSGFEMIFVGAGVDAALVQEFCSRHSWAYYPGPFFGSARVPYFKLADVFLMPGALGLAIFDAFALKTPIVATEFPYNGPEIEYLQNGENGILTRNNLDAFVAGTLQVLFSADLQARLKDGCRRSAAHCTLENMVNNFVTGIQKALSWDPVGQYSSMTADEHASCE